MGLLGLPVFYGLLLLTLYALPAPKLFEWQTWSTAYLDQDGQLLRLTLADDESYRLETQLEDVSDSLIQAALLYEDKDFYDHSGVDFTAIGRAFWHTYVVKNRQIGGSTISMQVARMSTGIDSSHIPGKLQQMLYALWIEAHYSKQEILTAYLNHLPYGGNIEGIEAASLIYFNKSAAQLNTAEAMALAVIPQNPSKRNPLSTKGYAELMDARARLLQLWQDQYSEDKHSEDKHGKNKQLAQWFDLPLSFRSPRQLPFEAPHFVNHLQKTQPFARNRLHTSIKLNQQKRVEAWIKRYLSDTQSLGYQNASALLLNHQTMEVEAWVGSAGFFNDEISGQVDGVTAKRSPGSTLKPLVYALAMDQGLIHPLSLLKDTPSRFAAYTPENYDLAYAGPIDATDALITSRNVPAIRLAAQLNSPNLYQLLQQAGITEMNTRDHYGLSTVLGGMETSMLELTRLYAMLANLGQFQSERTAHTQSKQSHPLSIPENTLLSPESAWLTYHMLTQNPPTDSPHYSVSNTTKTNSNAIAWKTGTSFAFRDAWSVGFDDQYVLAVWVGNFDGTGNPNLIGRKAAAPLFFKIFRDLQSTTENNNTSSLNSMTLKQPPELLKLNVKKVDICEATGFLPGKHCPMTVKSWFIPGVSPIKTGNVFRAVPVNIQSGKRACRHQPGKTRLDVYEFWPSDLSRLFQMAGIQRKQPPEYEADCQLEQLSADATPPRITTPVKGLVYFLTEDEEQLPFEAILDADVKHAYWFLDGSFIGKSTPNKPLFWNAEPGKYLLTVTDDHGLTDSIELEVQRMGVR
ncbi:penicillin-binding protein 1C [Litoribrevibacter euphylliae]|uniref:peptidoglycan glycosyltransferase n=1 Tax=Litoribrevibacter euphylliae TaxID=1834034 RepID=A0ABV7H9F4_9GAMM